ncbi:MAG TPA: hypothetical protein VN132_00440 [Bdellovibrio sp.]|nr:hypothetical protein [Bdellovibrio sp.]
MKIFVFYIVCLGSLASFAGTAVSGGGKSIVCEKADGTIESAQVLDLYEAKALYQLQTLSPGKSVSDYIEDAKAKLLRLSPNFAYINGLIDLVRTNTHYLPSGSKLIPVEDAAPVALPAGCHLKQLAFYKDDSLVLIDSDIWNALDNLNKAALILHEAIYRYERGSDTNDSGHARKFVGYLLSNTDLEPILDGVTKNSIHCQAFQAKSDGSVLVVFQFYYLPDPKSLDKATLQFDYIRGLPLYSKTVAQVPAFTQIKKMESVSVVANSKFEDVVPFQISRDLENSSGVYIDGDFGRFKVLCGANR